MNILNKIPELKDQINLFETLINDTSELTESQIKIIAWSAALQTKNKETVAFVTKNVGTLNAEEEKIVTIAWSRMSITNPYFMGRSIRPINAGGNLDTLQLRNFNLLGISDHTAYHFACVAFAILNGGYMCFNSHVASLEQSFQTPTAIDHCIRLAVAVAAINQLLFLNEITD